MNIKIGIRADNTSILLSWGVSGKYDYKIYLLGRQDSWKGLSEYLITPGKLRINNLGPYLVMFLCNI